MAWKSVSAGAKAQGLVFCSLNPMSGPGASDDLGLRGGEAARSVRRLQPGQIRGAAVVSQLRTTAAAMAAVPCWRRWSGAVRMLQISGSAQSAGLMAAARR